MGALLTFAWIKEIEFAMTEYRIFAQNEKYGLLYGKQVVLDCVYASIHIISEDAALEDLVNISALQKLYDAWSVISEMDFAILAADGKMGLVSEGQVLLEFKYDQIIKLTYCHFLCQEAERYILYDIFYSIYDLRPKRLATINIPGGLTLEKMLSVLAKKRPKAREMLSKYLYKDPGTGTYISEYQHWLGRVGYHCIFPTVAIQKVRMHDDFGVALLEISKTY